MTRPDVAVVGAGLVGAACADALVSDGHTVELIDAGDPASGATAAGMGHIVAMDDSEAQFALTAYSRRLWRDLVPELPRDVEADSCGTLWVAADDDEMQAVRSKQAEYAAHGVEAEILDARSTAAAEPNLRPGLAGGLRVPGDLVVYAPCAARWLIGRAMRGGAKLRAHTRVTAMTASGVRLADGGMIAAGAVINATGVEAGGGIRPRKGHLAITDRYPGFVRHQIIELGYLKSAHGHDAESVAFNAQPRITGQVLIGSSRQYDRDDAAVEPRMLARMLARAIEYLPSLAALSVIRTWTGMRAATADGLPLIGRRGDGVWMAAGHEGLGITTSLGTARLIADQMAGRPTAIPAAPYFPDRHA